MQLATRGHDGCSCGEAAVSGRADETTAQDEMQQPAEGLPALPLCAKSESGSVPKEPPR
jgi:hypothetical protein